MRQRWKTATTVWLPVLAVGAVLGGAWRIVVTEQLTNAFFPTGPLLLVTAAFDVWGFCLGVVGIFVLLCTTKPLVGKGYLYPLVPFNGKALLRLLVREPISRDNT